MWTVHQDTGINNCNEAGSGYGPGRKLSEGLIFENLTGIAVDNILPDDDTNEAFREIDGNIAVVEWETEPLGSEPT